MCLLELRVRLTEIGVAQSGDFILHDTCNMQVIYDDHSLFNL